MQNHLSASNTSNIIGGVSGTMVQVPTTKTQSQYYTVDMSTQPHKLVNVQRPSSPYITIQHGSAATLFQSSSSGQPQYVRIQLPTAQPASSNFVSLTPANQNQSVNSIQDSFVNKPDVAQQRFVPLPANLNTQVPNLNQQKISIQLVQQPNQAQTSINQQVGSKNVHLKPNVVHFSDGLQIQPLLLSPQKSNSLVGTVSVAQPTQMIQIADLVQQQKKATPQFTLIQASPSKKPQQPSTNVPTTSSSLFQAFQQAAHSTPLNSQIVTRFPTSNVQTVLTTLNPQLVDIQPRFQQQQQQQQQNSTPSINRHGTALLYGSNASKIDDSSPAYQGAVMMINANQVPGKRQVLAPKITEAATQQTQMFVPITMSSNVSVFTNHSSLLPNKSIGQMGHQTTLRIQQQIAPRSSSSLPASSTTAVNSTINQQKILIPIQSSVEQQQYIIQSLPQNILQLNSQLNGKNQQNVQQRDNPEIPTNTKSSKSSATSFVSSIADSKPAKKPCNCTKSQCLKLYCECFANGEFCNNCNCRLCRNSIAHEVERSKAIKACLERNPYAFHPKIGKGKVKGDNERRHTKGCNCKRSGCLKNYCECYEAKILCSGLCKCSGCKNFEESSDRQTLMHLADAAEVRVLQQNAARTKFAAQTDTALNKASKEKLPFTFMTTDVSKATCDVLLACVQEAEVLKRSPEETEKSVLEEFSRCLNQIIEKSKKAKQGKR